MLTKEELDALQFPFKANEHEFLKDKAYITESAITSRIETIDPSWTLEQVSLINRENTAICTMRLTIKGVWRDGVGMSQVVMTKSGNGEANEAEKSAATDAMKRAARLFGIGRYLLDLPPSVVNEKTLRDHLVTTYANTPTPPQPVVEPTPQPPQPAPAAAAQTVAVQDDGREVLPPKNDPPRVAELRNETLVIVRIEARHDSAGWYGIGYTDGLETRVNLFAPEDVNAIKDAGYEFKTGRVEIPVILRVQDNRLRIASVEPKETSTGQPDANTGVVQEPAWYATPVKDCWGVTKGWLLNQMYSKNPYEMNNSLKKHGITDNTGTLTDEWAGKPAGDLIKFLEARHEQPLPEAS